MKKFLIYLLFLAVLFPTGCEESEKPEALNQEDYVVVAGGALLPMYEPLENVNTKNIEERFVTDEFAYEIMTGEFIKKTEAYSMIKGKDEAAVILRTKDGYIAVGETSDGSYPGDVYIAKYDKLLLEKTYGGSDFDYPYTAAYNENMGILVSGKSQSGESVFGNNPFTALFDKDTLELKWSKRVQFAGSADCLSDTAAYLSCGKTTEDGVKIVITKVSEDGEVIWESEPLEQMISDMAELSSGKVIVSQHYAKDEKMVNKFVLIDENGKILKETETEIYGNLTATDDGGFIIVAERPVRSVPQPPYISAIWTDNETVAAKYDEGLNLVWRKTYDTLQGEMGTDTVVPEKDGSLMIKKAEKVEK